MKNKEELSRRRFISNTAMASIGTIGAAQLLISCAGNTKKTEEIKLPALLNQAPDGKVLFAYSELGVKGHVSGALNAVKTWRAAHPKG